MKSIILLHFFSLMMLQIAAQTKTVKIHGVVKDTTLKSIEIIHLVGDKLTKWENTKLNVENGAFNTSIQIPFPVEISISHGNRVYGKNYIYSDAEILIDSAGEPHVIGSATQDEYENEFLPFFLANDKLFDSAQSFSRRNHQKYGDDFPKLIKDSANLLIETYCYQRARLLGEYIKLHPNSYVALWNIYWFISIAIWNQYFDFEKLFSYFSNQMQQQSFINVLKTKIKESDKMQVGQIFPIDFLKGYEQMQNKIKKNNQYYLIDFWYSHCAPCVAGFPELKEIYNQFHGKGFDIVSISVDKQKDKKDYVAAIKKNRLAWNHVWDKDGVTSEKFNINIFPTYILLDKNDRIINFDIQANQLEAFLKENL
ncbi:MAG TPA: TlpA disulfide reductase family protein [Chitinophagaceae bacterium]|nr:TlpA disulfide reductase family protein [Chitinophagaceae bacterium]